jgi:hypothetical protein
MKPFDQQLYDRDDAAKYFVIDWLKTLDIHARVNPDPYGIDLLATGPLGEYEIEVEVKQSWSGHRFPYSSLHFAGRKDKFIRDGINLRFVTLNKEWTYAAIVSGEQLSSAQVIKKNTIYTTDESFIEIPAHQIQIRATNQSQFLVFLPCH